MGLLDEWNKVKRNENNRAETKKWALTKGAPGTSKSYFSSNTNVDPMYNPDTEIAQVRNMQNNAPKEKLGPYHSGGDRMKRGWLPPGWRERNAALTAQQEQQSLMDSLMERISGTYEPIMPGMPDPNAPNPNDEIMARLTGQLDQALTAKLGAINNVRQQAQSGYDTSDRNLAGMFGAYANNIATEGSNRYNQIGTDLKAGLTGTRDESLNRLAADRNNAMAERAAMLQRLGIQEAGAQADPSTQTVNDAMTGITNRSNVALQGADQSLASNLAFNQSVVNSVNQQGAERRAALLQQLQSIQNELGMAEAEAQQQNAQSKSQLEIQRMQAEAEAQGQSFDDMNEFAYRQFRDDRDLAFDLYKTLLGQQNQEEESADMPRVQGFAGLAQDLVNQGVSEGQASQYIGALSNVVAGEYMQGVHPDMGYDRGSIIARRLKEQGIPDPWATHLATNYVNLGNNAYYNQQ